MTHRGLVCPPVGGTPRLTGSGEGTKGGIRNRERGHRRPAPGAMRELPNVIEQSVRNAAVQNANQMRTEGVEDKTPLSGESLSV